MLNVIFAVLVGALSAGLIPVNGALSDKYGDFFANMIYNLVALGSAVVVLLIRRPRIKPESKLPVLAYAGGVVGFFFVLFNNFAFGKISVSAILGLCLLGQSIMSVFVDRFGLFKMPKKEFRPEKFIGLAVIAGGIVVLLLKTQISAASAVVFAFGTGIVSVVSRSMNARLADETSVYFSTAVNYAFGSVMSAASVLIVWLLGSSVAMPAAPGDFYLYLGGSVGVVIVILSNRIVSKISSLYGTLLMFAGQAFTGILLDYLLTRKFSLVNLAGASLVLLGLAVNAAFDYARAKKSKPPKVAAEPAAELQ